GRDALSWSTFGGVDASRARTKRDTVKDIMMWNQSDASAMLTNEQLASLGGGRVAYLKAMRSEDINKVFPSAPVIQPGLQLFALLAADGSPIALTDSRDSAGANARSEER